MNQINHLNQILEKNKNIQPKFSDLLKNPIKVYCLKKLTDTEIELKNKLLLDEKKLKHIHYCCNNLVRLPYQMIAYKSVNTVKIAQFGLTVGRAGELLDDIGGIDYWWTNYKSSLEKGDWEDILERGKERFIEIFGTLDLINYDEIDRL